MCGDTGCPSCGPLQAPSRKVPNKGLRTFRFSWRGYSATRPQARTKEEAETIVRANRPAHIPEGTELLYFGEGQ